MLTLQTTARHRSNQRRLGLIQASFKACRFQIPDLLELSKVWKTEALCILRSIMAHQYTLSCQASSTDRTVLWENREYLAGHRRSLIELMKIADWAKPAEVAELFKWANSAEKRFSCESIFCEKLACDQVAHNEPGHFAFSPEDGVEFLCLQPPSPECMAMEVGQEVLY